MATYAQYTNIDHWVFFLLGRICRGDRVAGRAPTVLGEVLHMGAVLVNRLLID